MTTKSDPSQRQFGHCMITWEVRNYGIMACNEKYEVESSRFSVNGPGSLMTSWKLVLGHEAREEHGVSECEMLPEFGRYMIEESRIMNAHFVFCLERCDSGCYEVWVDWRVRGFKMERAVSVVAGQEHCFPNSCRHRIDLGVVFDYEREMRANEVLTFVCQMIVYTRNVPESFDSTIDAELRILSEDFKSLLKQNAFCDVEMRFEEGSLYAHKAILTSRCKSFVDVFKDGEKRQVIQTSFVDYEGLLKILDYLYSGDLANVFGRPSINLCASVELMGLTELVLHYIPEEHKIGTKINVKELVYEWFIHDFSMKDEYRLTSSILTNDKIDSSWQIHVFPRGVNNEGEDVSIWVENTEGKVWDDVCVQCAVLKKDESWELRSWKTLQRSDKKREMFEIETFMKRKTLIESLKYNLLRLGFKVVMSSGNTHTILGISKNLHVVYPQIKSLENLSLDMSVLRIIDNYTDVTLRIGEVETKAHKCILSARSPVLSDIFQNMKENRLSLTNIKFEVFDVLVDYMYCARLEVSDVNMLLDVYEAAAKLAMTYLKEKCSRVITESITLETVYDILNLADGYDDNLMKQKAMEFIQRNISDSHKQDVRVELKARKPESLCYEIDSITEDSITVDETTTESGDLVLSTEARTSIVKDVTEKASTAAVKEMPTETSIIVYEQVTEAGDFTLEEMSMEAVSVTVEDVTEQAEKVEDVTEQAGSVTIEDVTEQISTVTVKMPTEDTVTVKGVPTYTCTATVEDVTEEARGAPVEEISTEKGNVTIGEMTAESPRIEVEEVTGEKGNIKVKVQDATIKDVVTETGSVTVDEFGKETVKSTSQTESFKSEVVTTQTENIKGEEIAEQTESKEPKQAATQAEISSSEEVKTQTDYSSVKRDTTTRSDNVEIEDDLNKTDTAQS